MGRATARRYEPGHTSRAGLGGGHQRVKRVQMKALRADPGRPCPRCRLPMYADAAMAMVAFPARATYVIKGRKVFGRQLWAIDLDDYPGRRHGGRQVKRLAHRYCNRRAGQAVTTQILAARTAMVHASVFNRW
jgi:hypothetical protein